MRCSIEEAENLVLSQVRFINVVLEECRKRNQDLADKFGPAYGKFVGLGTVYEEAIHSLRKVKLELDEFLDIVRSSARREGARRPNSRIRDIVFEQSENKSE
jgi:hypothetical protein